MAGVEEAKLRVIAIAVAKILIEQGKGAFWAKEISDFGGTLGKDSLLSVFF
jgi:hypothetical protein